MKKAAKGQRILSLRNKYLSLITMLLFLTANSFAQFVTNNPRIWNVANYGAKTDGTNAVPGIQAATVACYLGGGGVVYLPHQTTGIYTLSDTLVTLNSTVAAGIRGGAANSQLWIPFNQTPFTSHPLINIEFRGESADNMFTSALVPYPINTSGVVLYSTITGSGTYPCILGSGGGGWLFGSINDAQVTINNLGFRVKAGVTGSALGPTMSGINFQDMSCVNFNNVAVDVDTASYSTVYPTAETFGIYYPQANNSAWNPIHNCLVTGFKYGYIFSEHTNGDNLSATTCEYAFVFGTAGHAESFNRLDVNWCKYIITSTVGTIHNWSSKSWINIAQLDAELFPIGSGHWFDTKYAVYDSAKRLFGCVYYHYAIANRGVVDTAYANLGGDSLLYRNLGAYYDTVTRFKGLATIGKAYNDSLTLAVLAGTKEPALGNPGTSGFILSSTTSGTRSWVAQAAAGTSIFTRYGLAGTDSLKAYAVNYYRVGIFDTAISRFGVTTKSLSTGVNDTSGISSVNSTPAVLNGQQYSPYNSQTGDVWSTTGSARHAVTIGTYVQPVQAGTGTANLIWGYGYDHATPSTILTLNSAGLLTTTSLTDNGALTVGGTAGLQGATAQGTVTISLSAQGSTYFDRLVLSNANASTSGAPVEYPGGFHFSGTAWDGTASKVGDMYMAETLGSGASPITTKLVTRSQINAGGINDIYSIDNLGHSFWNATNTAVGTTGNQTINKASGTVNIAATGTTVTVTNSLVTTSSLIFCEIRTNDATARITSVVPAAGSFVVNIIACTAEVSIGFFVIN